jgi:4-hydroxy-3-polyprenylbenzoate decarboxylase
MRTLASIFLPSTRMMIPSLVDYDLPLFGGGRVAVASIEKHALGQAQRVAALALGTPGLAASRLLILIDNDVDVRNWEHVLAAIATHAQPATDYLHQAASLDPSDPLLATNERVPRMTIDATRKLRGESGRIALLESGSMPDEIVEQVSARWAELGLGP